jgi:hypothetical protein
VRPIGSPFRLYIVDVDGRSLTLTLTSIVDGDGDGDGDVAVNDEAPSCT